MSSKKVYLIYTGAIAFLFSLVFTVNQLYRIEIVKLDPFELVLVGTVLELSCFIFEVPTGIVADMKSRKLSVIIGLLLIGLAFIVEGLIPIYIIVLISQLIWGLGYTFTSGADEAWIADEIDNKELDSVYLRGAQVGQIFSLLGILISTVIGTYLLNLPIVIGGLMFMLLSFFLMFFMKETNFKPAPREDRDSFKQMWFTFKSGIKFIKGKTILVLMIIISLLYGLYSEGFDRLWQLQFLDVGFPEFTINNLDISFKPIVWFGIINTFSMLVSIILVEYIKRRLDKTGELQKVWLLIIINLIMVLSIILLGLSGNFIMAFSMYLAFYIVRITNGPIYRAWLNKNIISEVRATVISTYGQIDALGQVIGGPIIGFIALKSGVPTAMVVSGMILSPIVLIYIYILIKKINPS